MHLSPRLYHIITNIARSDNNPSRFRVINYHAKPKLHSKIKEGLLQKFPMSAAS